MGLVSEHEAFFFFSNFFNQKITELKLQLANVNQQAGFFPGHEMVISIHLLGNK